jgi:hypothetical protein
MHCHKSHHTMGAMGHDVPTMIGVDHRGLVQKIQKLIPDYMVMGERGMADMGEMEMELPTNTFPMMTGTGPYGSIEMGGMFTTLKVRADQKPGDYSDPGDYKQPAGTQAYEYTVRWLPHQGHLRRALHLRRCRQARCASPRAIRTIDWLPTFFFEHPSQGHWI